jgi:hypothetical protein
MKKFMTISNHLYSVHLDEADISQVIIEEKIEKINENDFGNYQNEEGNEYDNDNEFYSEFDNRY